MAIKQKIITHLRIETNPSFYSYSSFAIMQEMKDQSTALKNYTQYLVRGMAVYKFFNPLKWGAHLIH